MLHLTITWVEAEADPRTQRGEEWLEVEGDLERLGKD